MCVCVLAAVQQEAAAAAAAQTKEKFTTDQERERERKLREKLFASCCGSCFIDAHARQCVCVCVCMHVFAPLFAAGCCFSLARLGVYVMRYDVFAWQLRICSSGMKRLRDEEDVGAGQAQGVLVG